LIKEYGSVDEDAYELLGFEDEDENGGDEDAELDDEEAAKAKELDDDRAFEQFKTKVRKEAALRAEGNRRSGGLKTQAANVRDWKVHRFYLTISRLTYLALHYLCP
jgi:hypothetical protein